MGRVRAHDNNRRERVATMRCATGMAGVEARDGGVARGGCWLSHRRGVHHARLSVYIAAVPSHYPLIETRAATIRRALNPRPRRLQHHLL